MSRPYSPSPRNQSSLTKSRTDSEPPHLRQVYISPQRQTTQPNTPRSPNQLTSNQFRKTADALPPKANHFKRDNRSRSRLNETRLYSEERGNGRGKDLQQRARGLQERLSNEVREKQKLQQLNKANLLKLKKVMQQVSKATMQKGRLEQVRSTLQYRLEDTQGQLKTARNNIEGLNRTIQQMKQNTVYSNVKSMQAQVQSLTDRNTKLTKDNQQLQKANRILKEQLENSLRSLPDHKDSTEESSELTQHDKMNSFGSASLQLRRLKGQIAKGKSQREKQLEYSLQILQKKLYQKQAQIKKMSIQLNFLQRKRHNSIDQVRQKKDNQIKDLRNSMAKITKQLKQTKEQLQRNDQNRRSKGKNIPPSIRKYKSSKNIGFTSQSEVTFELSSDI